MADVLDRLVEFLLRPRGISLGPLQLQLERLDEATHEQTLRRISEARINLSKAISAMDDLKADLSLQVSRLDSLNALVKEREQELELLQKLRGVTRKQLKRALGRGLVQGLVLGIIASLAAAILWEKWLRGWWNAVFG